MKVCKSQDEIYGIPHGMFKLNQARDQETTSARRVRDQKRRPIKPDA